jgi:vesicular inhibitory amino acid transporter
MSPWGGHSVFPNIYRDMRHPYKFKKAIKITFSFTYLLDMATAIAGILMFGDGVKDELTANIISTSAYPQTLTYLLSILIAIIPLTKAPLNARPIVSTLEVLFGLSIEANSVTGLSNWTRGLFRVMIRIVVVIVFVIIAILFPDFDSIMAFMGSTLCFTICIILPLCFYLKIFGKEISAREKALDYFLIVICSILATVGTVFAFLPKEMIGAK